MKDIVDVVASKLKEHRTTNFDNLGFSLMFKIDRMIAEEIIRVVENSINSESDEVDLNDEEYEYEDEN